jgi:hypothetical protein
MADSNKPFTDYDHQQIFQKAYNPADATIAVGSFVGAELGNNVQAAYPNATTETYSYYEGTRFLYTLTVIYTDSTKANLLSVTRTA